jgi:hypothetical protein
LIFIDEDTWIKPNNGSIATDIFLFMKMSIKLKKQRIGLLI